MEKGDKDERRLLKISRSLEGMTRHASTHASGVVISDRPLVEYLPLYKGGNGEIMTQFTMDQIEKLGLIKFDFLLSRKAERHHQEQRQQIYGLFDGHYLT